MAGILESFGVKSNPFTSFVGDHRSALLNFGAGLAGGRDFGQGISMGLQGAAQGRVADDAYATSQKAEAERLNGITKTQQYLQSKGYDDLLPLIEAGQGDAALSEAFRRDKGEAPQYFEVGNNIVSVAGGEATPIYEGGADPSKAPTLTSIYDENGREQKGYMNGTDFVPVGSPKATTERPEFTVSQSSAAGFADRMTQSDAIISKPEMTKVMTDIVEHRGDIPIVGNLMSSPEYQQADQAKRDFINATLRRESGAVISDSEFANANRQYFPQPGDSEAVLKQKAANRRNVTRGVARAAGPAYASPDTADYLAAPPGASTKVIGNVTYVQDANGEWYEQ